ncbi:hypothetical protein GF318_04985 [Candidatus Micrarchaeota archaeon]|nr:hypothetical protein [Candidatus Micrarchaeota archaeon]
MNKPLILLLALVSVAGASTMYNVDVDRAGHASVTVSLQDEGHAEVALPPDAGSFMVVGGSYSISNDTAFVNAGKTGLASFSFSSNSLTSKSGSLWTLAFSPPEGSEATVFMPPYSTIESVSPNPEQISSEGSRARITVGSATVAVVEYRLESLPPPPEQNASTGLLALAGAIIIASIILGLSLKRQEKQEKKKSLALTEGKREMMGTFNDNGKGIVNYLLKSGGKARRNTLERKTGISKSSLSMALNRLEKRRIIEIDRGSTTHYVKLSDYFLGL